MASLISSYTSWQPLEEVIVGRVYTPEHFSFIKDQKVRSQLSVLLDETNQDLDNLQRTIEQFGARVRRPEFHQKIDWFLKDRELAPNQEIPIPPITPRDWQITLGEKLLRVLHVPDIDHIVDEYQQQQPGSVINPHANGYDPNHVMVDCNASCIVRVGTDVFFDNSEWLTTAQMEWIRDNVLDDRYRVHRAITNGHGDAVFAILKPGVIISSMHDADINYQQSFPGWEVHKIWDASIWAAMEVGKFRYENFNGRWWIQGHEPTEEFSRFVDTWLTRWTGFVSETVFDVNCLVLDEHHVIFSSYNREVFEFCRRHKIEPIICELRHKYFFDGGISCCTQDIRRRGGLETYI
jgi:hypothetical protein